MFHVDWSFGWIVDGILETIPNVHVEVVGFVPIDDILRPEQICPLIEGDLTNGLVIIGQGERLLMVHNRGTGKYGVYGEHHAEKKEDDTQG